MRPIEISDFNAADEFVVEAMMQDGKFKVIGKVIIDNKINPRFIPQITEDMESFPLLINFDLK